MTDLSNHPGMWLGPAAAASLERLEADHGRISLNSAGRTEAEQQDLINRWNRGGTYNRPPYLYQPASPASSSNHVKDGGVAIDTSDITKMREIGLAYGWDDYYTSTDPVHFEYREENDQKLKGTGANQDTRNRQNWLNASRNAGLAVDGIEGPLTTAAYKSYQEFLKSDWGYEGKIDGKWGPQTQAAHQRYYDAWNTPAAPAQPAAGVPVGLPWRGIQEMLRAYYGYNGAIDNIAGPQTIAAFQRFLGGSGYQPGLVDGAWGKLTGMAAQRWLKARWGYGGAIDNDFGAGTRAAWAEAERQNAAAF